MFRAFLRLDWHLWKTCDADDSLWHGHVRQEKVNFEELLRRRYRFWLMSRFAWPFWLLNVAARAATWYGFITVESIWPMFAWLDSGGGGVTRSPLWAPRSRNSSPPPPAFARLRHARAGHGSTSVGPTVDSYGPPPESSQAYLGHMIKMRCSKWVHLKSWTIWLDFLSYDGARSQLNSGTLWRVDEQRNLKPVRSIAGKCELFELSCKNHPGYRPKRIKTWSEVHPYVIWVDKLIKTSQQVEWGSGVTRYQLPRVLLLRYAGPT